MTKLNLDPGGLERGPMKQLARTLASLAFLLPTVKVLPAASCASHLNFKLYRDYTVVAQGSVAGLSEQLNFIIDTGAVPSVLDARLARRLKLRGRAETLSTFDQTLETRRITLPGLALGPIRVGPTPVLVENLALISRQIGVRVDGMIGLDVLSRCDFTIDYDSGIISFGAASSIPNGKGGRPEFTAPFEFGPGYAVVRLDVAGRPVRLMVDTGTRSLVLFAPRIRGRLPPLPRLHKDSISKLGGDAVVTEVGVTGAFLGATPLQFQRASLMEGEAPASVDLDGLLGVRSLGARRFGFDFEHRTIKWAK
jgi:hypothetical protein